MGANKKFFPTINHGDTPKSLIFNNFFIQLFYKLELQKLLKETLERYELNQDLIFAGQTEVDKLKARIVEIEKEMAEIRAVYDPLQRKAERDVLHPKTPPTMTAEEIEKWEGLGKLHGELRIEKCIKTNSVVSMTKNIKRLQDQLEVLKANIENIQEQLYGDTQLLESLQSSKTL